MWFQAPAGPAFLVVAALGLGLETFGTAPSTPYGKHGRSAGDCKAVLARVDWCRSCILCRLLGGCEEFPICHLDWLALDLVVLMEEAKGEESLQEAQA